MLSCIYGVYSHFSTSSIATTVSAAATSNHVVLRTISTTTTRISRRRKITTFRMKFSPHAFLKQSYNSSSSSAKSSVHYDSLKVLEWDKVADSVSSFATTSLGRDATKAQLWSLDQTYEESMRLLDETNAAVEMRKHGGCSLDFGSVDVALVKSAIEHTQRGLPMEGFEAIAVMAFLELADTLLLNLKGAIKEDSDWYGRFMPLTEMIMEMVTNPSLAKLIQQVMDEDGSVKDSASPVLKKSREQVRILERKLYQLMDSLIRTEMEETSSMEVSNIDGRWCIRSGPDQLARCPGLLLSSGSGVGSIVEPLSAVPLNDELQQARALVLNAETDVLLMLTKKMEPDLDDIRNLLNSFIRLDVINARAAYSFSFGGTCPDLFIPQNNDGSFTTKSNLSALMASNSTKREWTLYLPKAYHPLLLQQYRLNLQKARKDVSNATTEIRRRRLLGGSISPKGETEIDLPSLQMQVTELEEAKPVPVDFFIAQKTRVLVITGPNTGGKTICLKTIGLAAMMAKSGLYVLASEPVRIPWFDSVFTDIGDEQSLSQSLSTFSGHLKQISDIQSQSTSQSLILLDEVGAGTNPLEGAALGMSILEFFAEKGILLTIATTHHGELKTLKYSYDAFENACMEFDEVDLKPTYKILWGVPGRSNAINIAERLGLPGIVVDHARELYGEASAEINEVIIDMERFKQEFQQHLTEGKHYMTLSRDLHEKLLLIKNKIMEYCTAQRYKKNRELSEYASMTRSMLHKKVRQLRTSVRQPTQPTTVIKSQHTSEVERRQSTTAANAKSKNGTSETDARLSSPGKKSEIPKVGDMVQITTLGKKAMVLKVESSKQEIVVQVGNMTMKLKLTDIRT